VIELNPSNDVSTELWYTSSDEKSLDFIRNIAKYVEPIIQRIEFVPRMISYACPSCDSDFKKSNCVSNGKYCAMHHDYSLNIEGREIIMENLR